MIDQHKKLHGCSRTRWAVWVRGNKLSIVCPDGLVMRLAGVRWLNVVPHITGGTAVYRIRQPAVGRRDYCGGVIHALDLKTERILQ